jgi:hypothetical protein
MAAMSVGLVRPPPDTHTLHHPSPTATALRQATPSSPWIFHTSTPSRLLYYLGISLRQRGVHLLHLLLLPQNFVQFSTSGTPCAAPCWAHIISLLSVVHIETPRWENKKKQHWKTKKFMYIIIKAHTLLDSEMWSQLLSFSSYLCLQAYSTKYLCILCCDNEDSCGAGIWLDCTWTQYRVQLTCPVLVVLTTFRNTNDPLVASLSH